MQEWPPWTEKATEKRGKKGGLTAAEGYLF
jgi:hypothetical protein